MSAVLSIAWADLRRRKLQSAVIFVVILLSSLAATLALSLLVETDAPFDHAFAAAHGAHLNLIFSGGKVDADQLAATRSAHGVTGAEGPLPVTVAQAAIPVGSIVKTGPGNAAPAGTSGNGSPPLIAPLQVVGRDQWETPVDRLTIESGRWVRSAGEIVLSRQAADRFHLAVGDSLTIQGANGSVDLKVVGVAAAMRPDTDDAWVLPSQIPALVAPQGSIDQEMLYRVTPNGTDQDLRDATQSIAQGLPADAIAGSDNYLQAKRDADLTTAVMIPFLVAFSVVGLVISALIIGNVVSGAVISSYRDLGIMKTLGMMPSQVILVMMLQIVVVAIAGCLVGIPLGTFASQPFLHKTAHALGLPAPFTAAAPSMIAVLLTILIIAVLASVLASWRAGRESAVSAITMGSAPSRSGSRLGGWVSRLPLPRAVGLGIGDTFASPFRSITTTFAIVLGVATVVFALGLHLSLGRIAEDLIRDRSVQVTISAPKRSQVSLDDQRTANAIQQNPNTAKYTAESSVDATVPGIAEPVPYYAYRGDSSWVGYAMISGRWFSAPGEVVAPSALIDQAHLHIGDHFTAQINGKSVQLTLVGEILDQDDNDLLLRGDWSAAAAVDPGLQPTDYEVQLRLGVDPQQYAASMQQSLGDVGVGITSSAATDTTFRLFNSVIAGLALVLAIISVTGVLNTVVLSTRERAREIAILKAVGMAPAQVVAMVIGSVVLLGAIGGCLGIPIGLLLQHQVLTIMGQIASDTRIPPSAFDVFGTFLLPGLALTGLVISAVGAFLPARWAASGPTAEVLQAE
jgi:putative ABC transport system permease protein